MMKNLKVENFKKKIKEYLENVIFSIEIFNFNFTLGSINLVILHISYSNFRTKSKNILWFYDLVDIYWDKTDKHITIFNKQLLDKHEHESRN